MEAAACTVLWRPLGTQQGRVSSQGDQPVPGGEGNSRSYMYNCVMPFSMLDSPLQEDQLPASSIAALVSLREEVLAITLRKHHKHLSHFLTYLGPSSILPTEEEAESTI